MHGIVSFCMRSKFIDRAFLQPSGMASKASANALCGVARIFIVESQVFDLVL